MGVDMPMVFAVAAVLAVFAAALLLALTFLRRRHSASPRLTVARSPTSLTSNSPVDGG